MTPEENKSLATAMVEAMHEGGHILTEDERRWVRLAIEKEAQSIKLRQAIIEKTLAGLAWAAVVALGSLLWGALQHPPKG